MSNGRLCVTRDACPIVPLTPNHTPHSTHLLPNTRSLPFEAAAAAAEAAAFWARNPAPVVAELVVVVVGPTPHEEALPWAEPVAEVGVSTTLHGCTNHLPRRTTSRDNKLLSIKLCSALKSRPRPSYDNAFSQDPW